VKFQTVKNCGELGVKFQNIDSDGARVSRDFLRKLLNNAVKRCTDYYNETGEHIFTYREKQLHSVICPSIADITPSYMIEHPLKRRPSGEDEISGHVDYWISYRNYSFLMELKHCYFAYRNADNPSQRISYKFNSAMNQLKNIRKDECKNLTINKGLIKIALLFVVFYEGSKDTISTDILGDRDFKNLFKKLMENVELQNTSNLRCLWLLNERLIETVEYANWSEIYPAVAAIGNISEMI